ncbi:MAG: reverse transcriptase family protein [Planctomycetota bacterium]
MPVSADKRQNRHSKAWPTGADPSAVPFMPSRFTLYLWLGLVVLVVFMAAAQRVWAWAFARQQRRIGALHAALARRRARRYLNRFDVGDLADRLGLTQEALAALDTRYQAASIPKRRGGRRHLAIPNPQLKTTQRLILRRLLRKLRTHPAATGFESGVSITHNAAAHVGQAVVIKMDLVDFFPSTSAQRVEAYFRRIGWTPDAATLLTRLTTHNAGLPQGAPTSPRLSNLVNFVMDAQIQRWVAYRKGVYTRYADDLTISFPKDYPKRVRGTIQHVRRVAQHHGYAIHTRGKLRVVRRHQPQRVTGLVVNDRVNLPRGTRRWLRAVEHRQLTTGRASLTREQLAGWHALQHMIENQRLR